MRVCTPILLNCDYCFTLDLIYYNTIMNVLAGLTPASTPYIWITDKFGNQYSDQVTIKANGSFDIEVANYPDGLFSEGNGWFDLFVSSDVDGLTIVPMVFYDHFNCVKFKTTCP